MVDKIRKMKKDSNHEQELGALQKGVFRLYNLEEFHDLEGFSSYVS